MRRPLVAALFACLALSLTGSAAASEILGDVNVRDATLRVNEHGLALVTYIRQDGRPREVLAWGAENALHPDPAVAQVRFSYDYSGGRKRYGRRLASSFRNACAPYDGPALALLVAACKAPDGSYWALQAWQRLQPMRGFEPFTPRQAALELHLSHWSEPLPLLEVSPNWTYGGALQGLVGRLSYRGVPVHGFRTPSSRAADRHARHVYIDTLNSVYGPGWRRDTAVVTHRGNGAFCYSFVGQAPPAGYPSTEIRGPGNGERHRVTAIGPGVTPIVQWEGAGLGPYDPAADRGFDALFDRLVGFGDPACARER